LLGGGQFTGFGRLRMNDNGGFAGSYLTGFGNGSSIFQLKDGVQIDHGQIGNGLANARLGGINNSGQLATWAFRPDTGLEEAVRIDGDGTVTIAGTLAGGDTDALAINSSGTMTGASDIVEDESARAYLYNTAGTFTNLGTLGGDFSRANGINDLGQVVGRSFVGPSFAFDSPFIWTPENGMQEITDVPGNSFRGSALDINESGWVVGQLRGDIFIRTAEGDFIPNVGEFFLPGEAFSRTIGGQAMKILETDFAAYGNSTVQDGQNFFTEPWLWTAEEGTEFFDEFDLVGFDDDDWDFSTFTDANELGQILAGARFTPTGEFFTVLLTRVPEPATAPLLLLAAAITTLRRRR